MLTELHIENIAVIERADIEPGPGLNVLTGETGAGKSIVIDSLQAVLGGRTSRELVRTGAAKAAVAASFTAETLSGWLGENGLEEEEAVVIRRRISADGKSSASVCGMPVTASELRAIGVKLLDIHGQNDGRQLMDESRHRAYLDSFGALVADLEEYRRAYGEYADAKRELERLNMGEDEKRRLADAYRYRLEELEAAELREGEEAELSARRDLLRNAGRLTDALDAAYDALYGADGSACELAGEASAQVARAANWASELGETASEIDGARMTLEDAAERLRDLRESLDFSPEEYDALETRLAQLHRLEKKYAADESGLIAILEESRKGLEEIEYSDERREKLASELAKKAEAAYNAAKGLSKKRSAAAEELQRRIQKGLSELSMPSVRFVVEITPKAGSPGFDETGCDEVRFLMSANAGETPGRISKIASGGELARIMLVMKDVLSERDEVGTLVFDEIDEGVSGIAAQRVAEKLARLSRRKQVICVTHLPQIAAMADTHFHIEKRERGGRTYTAVTPLDRDGRIREIARLHGGDNITDTTLASAAEQLDAAVKYKQEEKA